MAKNYNDEGVRLTDCCKAFSTISMDDGELCCKVCWRTVGKGQGDGTEYDVEAIIEKGLSNSG